MSPCEQKLLTAKLAKEDPQSTQGKPRKKNAERGWFSWRALRLFFATFAV
jgi:hypothetical protein